MAGLAHLTLQVQLAHHGRAATALITLGSLLESRLNAELPDMTARTGAEATENSGITRESARVLKFVPTRGTE